MTKNLKNSLYNHHHLFGFGRPLDPKYMLKIKKIKFPTLIFDVESIFEGFGTIVTCKNGQKTPFLPLQRIDTSEIVVKFDQKSFLTRHFTFLGGKWPGDVKYGFLKVFWGQNTNKKLILEKTRRDTHTGKYRNLKEHFQDSYQNLILLERQLHFPTQEYDSARRFSICVFLRFFLTSSKTCFRNPCYTPDFIKI